MNVNRVSDCRIDANPEEQIIQRRGRRQIPATPTRRSPRKKRNYLNIDQHHDEPISSRRRRCTSTKRFSDQGDDGDNDDHGDDDEGIGESIDDGNSNRLLQNKSKYFSAKQRTTRSSPGIQESPFTKCLRDLRSPPRPAVSLNRTTQNIRRRLLLSPVDDKSLSTSTPLNNNNIIESIDFGSNSKLMTSSDSSSSRKYHYYSPISHNLRSSDTPPTCELFNDSGIGLSSSVKKSTSSINRAKRHFRF